MKIAVLSDIHSNVFALEAVIHDLKNYRVDVTVNLGDILYGPIAPRATYDLLMENEFVTIRGNQDRQIYEATQSEIESNPTLRFIMDELEEDALDWLKGLPFDKQLSEDIYLCHGTPEDDLTYLLENIKSGFARLHSDEKILERLKGQSSEVILCGHSHTPRVFSTRSQQLIVNPGSVGMPAYADEIPVLHKMQNHSPHASYAIIDRSKMGWNVQHIRVAYNYKRAAEKAKSQNRPDWAQILCTGRA